MYTQIRLNLVKTLEALHKKQNYVILIKNPGTLSLVNILLLLGYIHSYSSLLHINAIKVFLKYGALGRTLTLVLTKRIFISHNQLLLISSFNPRVTLLILTPSGLSFTKQCLRDKSSGFLLAEIY
jgi:ribosomal protein S8